VNIFSVSPEGMKIARDAIVGMTAEAEIGKVYRGKVVTNQEFGAFVEFLPGKDGLVHISELANFRVKKTEILSNWATKSWSNAWAWTKRAVCASRAKPRWPSVTGK